MTSMSPALRSTCLCREVACWAAGAPRYFVAHRLRVAPDQAQANGCSEHRDGRAQPRPFNQRPLAVCPMMPRSCATSITNTNSGGARKPLRTAVQNSASIGLMPRVEQHAEQRAGDNNCIEPTGILRFTAETRRPAKRVGNRVRRRAGQNRDGQEATGHKTTRE